MEGIIIMKEKFTTIIFEIVEVEKEDVIQTSSPEEDFDNLDWQ